MRAMFLLCVLQAWPWLSAAQNKLILAPSVVIVKPQQVLHDDETARYIRRQERLLLQAEGRAQESFMQQIRNEYTGLNILYDAWMASFNESQRYAIRLMRQHFNYFELDMDFSSRVVSSYARFLVDSYGITALGRLYNTSDNYLTPVFLPSRVPVAYVKDSLAALARKYKVQYVLYFPHFEIGKTARGYVCALSTNVYDTHRNEVVYANTFYGNSRDDKGRLLCDVSSPTCAVSVAISLSIAELVRVFEQHKLPYVVRRLWGQQAIASTDSLYTRYQQIRFDSTATGDTFLDSLHQYSDYCHNNAQRNKAIAVYTYSNLGDTAAQHANVFMGSAANWSVAPPSHIGRIMAYAKHQGRWYGNVLESYAIDAQNLQAAKASYCYHLNRWGYIDKENGAGSDAFWQGQLFRTSNAKEQQLLSRVYGLDTTSKVWIVDQARVDSVENQNQAYKTAFITQKLAPLIQRLKQGRSAYLRNLYWTESRTQLFTNRDTSVVLLATQFERKDVRFIFFFVYLPSQPQQLYAWTYNSNNRIFLTNYFNFKPTITNVFKRCKTTPQFERFIADDNFWNDFVLKMRDSRFAYLQPLLN